MYVLLVDSLQHQMPLFRKKMVWEILHQQLLWERPAAVPPAAGGSFTDGRFHIPHALWVKKSLHHLCSLTGTELLEVHEGPSLHPSPDLVCGGLLATLFIRPCLLRALDCQPTQEQTLINTFFKIFFFPYECGKCRIYSMICFFCVFVHVYSFTHSFANIMGSGCFLLLF